MTDLKLVDLTSRMLSNTIGEIYKCDSLFDYKNARPLHMKIFLSNVKKFYENKQYYYSRIKQTGRVQSVVCDSHGMLYLKVDFDDDFYTYQFQYINGNNII